MSTLGQHLPRPQHTPDATRQRNAYPKGSEPGVKWADDGTATVTLPWSDQMLTNEGEFENAVRGFRAELLQPGYRLRLVEARHNEAAWHRDAPGEDAVTRPMWLYRFLVEPIPVSAGTHDFAATVRTYRKNRKAVTPAYDGDATLCVSWNDWQIGKDENGGTDGTEARFFWCIDQVRERAKELKRINRTLGKLVVIGNGDIVEGCFAAETPVITANGILPIEQLAREGRATVRSTYGKWVEAEFRSFGVQPLLKIELGRFRERRTIFATANHRWFKWANPSVNSGKVELTTDELTHGDYLIPTFGRTTHSEPSSIGIMHGAIWGDGHRDGRGSSIALYGDKAPDLLLYFQHARVSPMKIDSKGAENIEASGLPAYFKDTVPAFDEDRTYLLGFLAGAIATDGSVSKEGVVSICQAEESKIAYIRDLCAILGIGTTQIMKFDTTAGIVAEGVLYRTTLIRSTIPPALFIRPNQRERFTNGLSTTKGHTFQKNRARSWQVLSVEPTDRVEEVYCAVVPGTRAFVLDGDILTGNCDIFPNQSYSLDMDMRGQANRATDMILWGLDALAPMFSKVVVMAVGGNHGQNRRGGNRINRTDNTDLLVFENAARAAERDPRLGHTSFVIANGEPVKAIDINGHIVAATHGDVYGKGSGTGIEQKVYKWKTARAGARLPGGDADLMLTAHYHHTFGRDYGSWLWKQAPALDGGSLHFTDGTGMYSRPGMLTWVTHPNSRYTDEQVLEPPYVNEELGLNYA